MSKKEFLLLIILTVVVVIIWVISDIMHTGTTVPISSNLEKAITPLDPNFDKDALEHISKRKIL